MSSQMDKLDVRRVKPETTKKLSNHLPKLQVYKCGARKFCPLTFPQNAVIFNNHENN